MCLARTKEFCEFRQPPSIPVYLVCVPGAQLDELRRKGLDRYKELGLDTLYLKNEHCREAFWKSLERVCETPAASAGGFAAKVLVLCERWD